MLFTIDLDMSVMAIYQCPKCGNVYEKTYAAGGCTPKCCGESCVEVAPKTGNPDENKHVPYFERVDGGVLVKVGKNDAHPMADDHYIVWIEICADGVRMRKYLKPGDKPEAFFKTDASKIIAREFCNKHGLWTYE
jgi:superoxide reductase